MNRNASVHFINTPEVDCRRADNNRNVPRHPTSQQAIFFFPAHPVR